MNPAIDAILHFGIRAWTLLSPLAVEGSALAVLAGLFLTVDRRSPPCMRCAIWLLVIVKLAVPIPLPLPMPFGDLNPARYVPEPYMNTQRGPNIRWAYPAMIALPLPEPLRRATESAPAVRTMPASEKEIETFSQTFFAYEQSAILRVGAAGLIWILSATLVFSVRLWRYRRVRRLVLRLASPASPDLAAMAEELRSAVGIKRAVEVLEAADLGSPLVLGFLRPVVLIPSSAQSDLARKELRSLLAHEFFHLKRRDHWSLPLELIATSLHWFNPAAWLAVRSFRRERERACDDAVVAFLGAGEAEYSLGLVKIVRLCGRGTATQAGALALFERKGDLESRIRRMAVPGRRVVPRLGKISFAAILFLGAAFLPSSFRSSPQAATPPVIAPSTPIPGGSRNDPVAFLKGNQEVRAAAGSITSADLSPKSEEYGSKWIFGLWPAERRINYVVLYGERGRFWATVETVQRGKSPATMRLAALTPMDPERPGDMTGRPPVKTILNAAASEQIRSVLESAYRQKFDRLKTYRVQYDVLRTLIQYQGGTDRLIRYSYRDIGQGFNRVQDFSILREGALSFQNRSIYKGGNYSRFPGRSPNPDLTGKRSPGQAYAAANAFSYLAVNSLQDSRLSDNPPAFLRDSESADALALLYKPDSIIETDHEMAGDHDCIVLAAEGHRMWFAPDLGDALVKREQYAKLSDGRLIVAFRVDCGDFFEAEKGFYLPRKATISFDKAWGDIIRENYTEAYTLKRIEFDPPLEDADFAWDSPALAKIEMADSSGALPFQSGAKMQSSADPVDSPKTSSGPALTEFKGATATLVQVFGPDFKKLVCENFEAPKDGFFSMRGHVRLELKDLIATADSMQFDPATKQLTLDGSPKVISMNGGTSTTMQADQITLHIDANGKTGVTLHKNPGMPSNETTISASDAAAHKPDAADLKALSEILPGFKRLECADLDLSKQDMVSMRGKVRLELAGLTATANQMIYDRASRELTLTGSSAATQTIDGQAKLYNAPRIRIALDGAGKASIQMEDDLVNQPAKPPIPGSPDLTVHDRPQTQRSPSVP